MGSIFLSLDLFLFVVMFEITLVPGYFIVAVGMGEPRRNSRRRMKFFIYTFAGSAFLVRRHSVARVPDGTGQPWPHETLRSRSTSGPPGQRAAPR